MPHRFRQNRTRRFVFGVACAVLIVPAIQPAYAGFAEEAVPAIRAFGLLGMWAPDCGKPISPENPRVAYSIGTQPETVIHTYSNSEAGVAVSDIAVYSEIVADDRLLIGLHRNGQLTTMGVIRRVGDGIQTTDSFTGDGRHLVVGGTIAANKQPSMVFYRCQP